MRLPLQISNTPGVQARLRDSEPFVENKNGILIHRPRRSSVHKIGDMWKPHMSIEYWCGQAVTGDAKKLTFISEPPVDSLLCEACESRAVMSGLPSASELAGRHVHTGKLKAIRTCCNGKAVQQ